MYDCLIKAVIIGEGSSLAGTLSAVEAPSECEVKFIPFDEFDFSKNDPDSACIFADASSYAENKGKFAYSAIICNGLTIPDGFDSNTTELWVVPENSNCAEELIKSYFSAFIRKIKVSFDHRRLLICHETAADDSPDLIWYKDLQGAHMLTNKAFCETVGKTKEQIYKKGTIIYGIFLRRNTSRATMFVSNPSKSLSTREKPACLTKRLKQKTVCGSL